MSIASVVTRGFGAYSTAFLVPTRGYVSGEAPPPPPPPEPPVIRPRGAHDAGPAGGFGTWFNLAFKAGPGLRGNRGALGKEIERLVDAANTPAKAETPAEIVEAAIERLADVEAPNEADALAAVAEEEARYRRARSDELKREYDARQAFIEAIMARAREEIERQRVLRMHQDDEDFVLMLSGFLQ